MVKGITGEADLICFVINYTNLQRIWETVDDVQARYAKCGR
ncbi:hypothetical protein SLEP1_g14024 [Rubroshorea leprosula]|uniref:Uncharacterized protein n=1 Tax=Rubroshorea leprosula TaxID=152421 RepID=A0AAV5ISD8_9ROSI|nr:hypothetical protein SLEP1_g14024 [Rubroshorea leprosula]